jgi:hypothetical protein
VALLAFFIVLLIFFWFGIFSFECGYLYFILYLFLGAFYKKVVNSLFMYLHKQVLTVFQYIPSSLLLFRSLHAQRGFINSGMDIGEAHHIRFYQAA